MALLADMQIEYIMHKKRKY